MIRIDKMYEGYYRGFSSPPDTTVDYRSPDILSAEELTRELIQRGAQQVEITAAFAEADRYWIPLPPRQ